MKIRFLLILVLVFLLTSCSLLTKGHKFNIKNPQFALVLSGPVNESSWNKAAYEGLKRFQIDHKNVEIAVVERVAIEEAEKVFTELAKKNYNLVLIHGEGYSETAKAIGLKYPDTFFCVIGGQIAQKPNVCSFSFKDEQYGFLVGIVTGLNTVTNKIGIVIGKNTPSIEEAIIGLRKGIKEVNPKADLIVSYINSWSDIAKGREAAVEQINTGVDIITHLADIAGIGVIKAAEEADISAVGAIEDQHDLAPTTVISSGIQDASQLVYLACEHYIEKTLLPEIFEFGLKDQVVDLSPSYGNVDPNTEARINRYKTNLVNAEIKQEEYARNLQKKRI